MSNGPILATRGMAVAGHNLGTMEAVRIMQQGGSFMDAQTRAPLAKRSTTVWLRAELDVLVRRVRRRTNSRPLLRDGDPHEILSRLIEEREPVYAQAALTIDSGDGAADDVVDDIISKLHDLRAKEAADETPHPDP